MSKKKILVPIDGTERSMHSLELVKSLYSKDAIELTIMYVKELVFINGMVVSEEIQSSQEQGESLLEKAKKIMDGYDVKTYFTFGYPVEEILNKSREEQIDIIVMTKSTKKGLTRMIGSVTSNVVKRAESIVMIVPE
ncbi:universal stress protein [Clostridium sp. MSJ-8]|uniref:universal stress protein n=1 Tax=Clostridium sp. MSJ-8 TaxID=2841510 RepID=UPI001C0F134D|nr:universal stress protein [Clostridium sp. MSJ-8]MBU5488882.1 universal stress protein [Clostridium sp. MSJ-8]